MAAASAVVLLAAGCSDDDDGSSEPSSTTSATETSSEGPAPTDPTETTSAPSDDPPPSDPVDHIRAIAIALETTPGTAIEIGQGSQGGQAVWEVLVRQDDGSGVEHYIAVATGEVIGQDAESVPSIASAPTAVSLEQALDIATDTVAGSEILGADLGTEGALTIWEVQVRSGSQEIELYIDATTGEVIKQEVDD